MLTVDLTAVSNAILEIDQAVAMNVFAVDVAAQESERVRLEFTQAPLVADDEECDPWVFATDAPPGKHVSIQHPWTICLAPVSPRRRRR